MAESDWKKQIKSPVAVLLGGRSSEREVSLVSGNAVLNALKNLGIDAVAIDTADGNWLQKIDGKYQHAFIALHGGEGENGTVQAILHHLGISYTGSGVAACALAMDKVRTKFLWKGMELPTAAFDVLRDDSDWHAIMRRYGKVIVKPATEGSSIGMSIAASVEELQAAYESARQYQGDVLVEQWIEGAEFTVAVLGETALPAIRLETDNSFYDYEAKYVSNDTRYLCPCGLDEGKEEELKSLALRAFNSLGCRGWGRADFMQDKQGTFYLLEVNTVPGMTSHSLVPMAAKAIDMGFDSLVAEILRLSLVVE